MGLKFKGKGGYLNEVDVTVVGQSFHVGDTVKIKQGQRKGEDFTPLSWVPEFLVDGEDEPKTQRLLLGDAGAYGELTEDDMVLATPDGQGIGGEVGTFLQSGVQADARFGDLFEESCTEEQIDLRPIVGTRMRLVQEINAKKPKQTNKKTGKTYDGRDLKIAAIHALPSEAPAPAKGAKAAPAKAAAKGGKPAKKEVDIPELAAETLKAIVEKAGGSLPKSKLSMAVLRALSNDDNCDAVREFLFDDDNLSSLDGFSYNAKKGVIKLDE